MTFDVATLPNLVIPGAARSGTTALHELLAQHPRIFMSPYKEPHVLSNPAKGLEDYVKLFHGTTDYAYRGESSTSYLARPDVAQKIKSQLPDARVIVMLRNPVERAWSHYWFIRGRFGERRQFRAAFTANIDAQPRFEVHNRFYFHNGMYGRWLEHYLSLLGPDRVHIVVFEEFTQDALVQLAGIYQFLGIEYVEPDTSVRQNESAVLKFPVLTRAYVATAHVAGRSVMRVVPPRVYRVMTDWNRWGFRALLRAMQREERPPMSKADREWIADFYRDDVRALGALTMRPYPWPDFA